MVRLVIGSLIFLLGLPFLIRGWMFSLLPEHGVTRRARDRNLRLGLETDMKRWGRRVRRIGLILCVVGGVFMAWGARTLD